MGWRSFYLSPGSKSKRSYEAGASTSEFLVTIGVVVLLAAGFHPAVSAIAGNTSDTLIVAGGGSATSNQTGGGVSSGGGTVDCNQPSASGYAQPGCACLPFEPLEASAMGGLACRPPPEGE